jgi:hypothetical protein
MQGEQKIVLNESDKIVNDQKEVANHFNNFFSTVAENIGKDTVYDPSDHPSLIEIKKQKFTILSDSLSTIFCSPLDPFSKRMA